MDNRCRWHFQGEVTIPKDHFDFNVNGGDRSLLGQFITVARGSGTGQYVEVNMSLCIAAGRK